MDESIDILTNFDVGFSNISDSLTKQITVQEIMLGESLLTPGLQTSVLVHSSINELPVKNLDEFKDTEMSIDIEKSLLTKFGIEPRMFVRQTTYRLDNRKLINNNTEEFYIHACDQTLLDNAATLVSKLWKCTRPSVVVRDVLSTCAGAKSLDIEDADPARDYIAENIRPFQVVAQQANVALAAGNDPSFLHYMTYENFGTHKFRSLYSLTQQPAVAEYIFQETGSMSGHAFPYSILTHNFPCDFDLLSDVLNGVGYDGKNLNSLFTFNPIMAMFNKFGSNTFGCGIGSGLPKMSMSNQGSAEQQNACPDYAHLYVHKRQARMGLLEQDKIALRIMVPWVPFLNAGKIIRLSIPNKADETGTTLNYGSGDYLIVSLKHHIKRGQPSTITMDCVSRTVGAGVV
jgi:hypothetical protein